MEASNFEVFVEFYDQLYQARGKDYKKEVKFLRKIINEVESRPSKTLLDVGCGTGGHLEHLSKDLECTGVDINRRMVEIARRKVPRARFKVFDMVNLELEGRFDVVTCLFSSIGYVQSFENLVKTFEGFSRHLIKGGIVIVEPWVFKQDFREGTISLDSFENRNLKLARMATSEISGARWLIHMHYLIGRDGAIAYAKELHEMALLDYEDYVEAFERARFCDVNFLEDNLWTGCRGLFIAKK